MHLKFDFKFWLGGGSDMTKNWSHDPLRDQLI